MKVRPAGPGGFSPLTQIQVVGGQWNQEMRQAFADWPKEESLDSH